jgi:hypothetical protein
MARCGRYKGRSAWAVIAAALIGMATASPTRADPIYGLAVNEAADGDYPKALLAAKRAGFTSTVLPVFWDDMMKDGAYRPAFDWPAIAAAVYPASGFRVALVLPVIDTVTDRRPPELQGLDWDSPALLAAFSVYVAEVLKRLGPVDLVSISIGNEVDAHLAGDDWAAYQRFFRIARAEVQRLRPGVPVGVNLTWGGLNGPDAVAAQALAASGDAWLVTYYGLDAGFRIRPPEEVAGVIDRLVALAGGKPLILAEVGYPSDGCGSDLEGQKRFFQTLLAALTDREEEVPLANLVWMNDISVEQLDEYRTYYGTDDDCFARYLGSLGLRTRDGQDKPAFAWIKDR